MKMHDWVAFATTRKAAFIAAALCAAPVLSQGAIIANFQAADYTTGATAWHDRVSNASATATGSPVGNGGSVTTTNGAFTFNTANIPGFDGLTSYTIAVGFNATSIPGGGGSNFYQGTGVVGGDIPNSGQGDSGMSLTTDVPNGQIVFGAGVPGGDVNLYDTDPSTGGTFNLNQATGAVLVLNGPAQTLTLYVNGALTSQPGTLSRVINPVGLNNNNGGIIEGFNYGIGTVAGGGGPMPGTITQFQIYNTALSPTDAAALSSSIALPSTAVPEPASATVIGLGAIALLKRRRSA